MNVAMICPAGPDEMASLRAAASGTDAALDLALLRVGILSPVDLDQIRSVLAQPATTLRATVNRDGHRIVEVSQAGRLLAQLHHDGRVYVCGAAGLAA